MSIILLEHPRPRASERYESVVNTPLSACLMTGYIASTLTTNRYDVDIVDANLRGWSFHETVQELGKKSCKLLGVHLVYLWENTEGVFELLLALRKSDHDVHINLYGHFPTFAFREILVNYPFVDSITIGEPEVTFLALAEAVIRKKGASTLHAVDGLAFHFINSKVEEDAGKVEVVKNKPRKPVANLEDLPFPCRNDFELLKKKGISTYILASRGCYGKCTFCYLDPFYGEESQWRERSPGNIFREIHTIYRDLGERYFYFADANFFGPGRKGRERACELARLLTEKGIKIRFGIECRVNDVEDKTIRMLVKAGLRDVFLGIESGSQGSLNRFRKYTTVEENKRAINILRRHGIEPNYGFIMFEPDSTLADIRANFEFLKEMKMLNSPGITAHLLHHKQSIFRGTFDYENNNGSKSDSMLGYESACEMKDKAVEALSEDINAFCLKALKDLSRNRGEENGERDSCAYGENDSFLEQMNEKLIEHFEKSLSLLEHE